MHKGYKLYLEDILESVNNIFTYTGDISYENLIQDRMRIDAVVRNFTIIGEAANNIPQEMRDKYPIIEWRKIIDFRNVIVHDYFGIDYEILWDIIKHKLPELQNGIKTILEKEP